MVTIDGRHYLRARLVWLFVYDEFPKHQIDHINHSTLDDRLENLRDATPAQNTVNRRPYGRLRVKGVSNHGNHFRATIRHRGRQKHLGTFTSIEAASAAYQKAACELYGEYAYNRNAA